MAHQHQSFVRLAVQFLNNHINRLKHIRRLSQQRLPNAQLGKLGRLRLKLRQHQIIFHTRQNMRGLNQQIINAIRQHPGQSLGHSVHLQTLLLANFVNNHPASPGAIQLALRKSSLQGSLQLFNSFRSGFRITCSKTYHQQRFILFHRFTSQRIKELHFRKIIGFRYSSPQAKTLLASYIMHQTK